jgi:hypothetical protein
MRHHAITSSRRAGAHAHSAYPVLESPSWIPIDSEGGRRDQTEWVSSHRFCNELRSGDRSHIEIGNAHVN